MTQTRPKTDTARICLYVHTHWDREWYWAFERYRNLLISATRAIIADLENGSLPSFHLDGQSCVIEDLLGVEPELEPRIKRLVKDGRLSVGPWYVLPDQMLVGGESLIRNLEIGMNVSSRLGEPMMVGYCPDTFGHTADLPRILRGFGIDTAVVWRGVPELDDGPEFFWKSADGSTVTALLLADGYYQTAFHEVWGESGTEQIELLKRYLSKWIDISSERKGTAGGVGLGDKFGYRTFSRLTNSALVPVGGDHVNPPQNFKKLLTAVQKSFEGDSKNGSKSEENLKESSGSKVKVETVLLGEYLREIADAAGADATPVRLIEGELRDNRAALKHCRGYMLPGVLSTRLYLKRENRLTEHRIINLGEPLYAMMAARGIVRYPQQELENAWKQLLVNHPHDSICGCSVDEVHREMMTRSSSINQVLDILDRRVREEILSPGAHEWSGAMSANGSTNGSKEIVGPKVNRGFGRWNMEVPDPDIPLAGHLVFNLSSQTVSAPVLVRIATPVKSSAASNLDRPGDTARGAHELTAGSGADVSNNLIGLLGSEFQMAECTRETEVFGSMGGVPMYHDVSITTGWLWSADIPPFGTKLIELKKNETKKKVEESESSRQPVAVYDTSISNEFFSVGVAGDGKLIVQTRINGIDPKAYNLRHRFVDVADAGDTYNFDPIPGDRPVEARFESVEPALTGPLVGSLRLVYEIELPESIEPKDPEAIPASDDFVLFERSTQKRVHKLTTEVILKQGVPILFFETSWENEATDHRLDVVFDTGVPVVKTWSENHFSLVERAPVKAQTPEAPVEKGTETPLDRYPCQRFFVANGQAFFNKGLPEYGVDGSSVSITLLRAVSKLSRGRLLTRGGGAGPHMPTPEANCLGYNIVEYGWAPLDLLAPDVVVGDKKTSDAPLRATRGYSTLSDSGRTAAYRLAEMYEGTLWCTAVAQGESSALAKTLQGAHSLFDIDNDSIVLSAFYSNDGGKSLLLRILNVADSRQAANILVGVPHTKIEKVDLAGNPLETLKQFDDERYKVVFGEQELVTLKVTL